MLCLCALTSALKHHLCHVLLYLWGVLVPSSPGSKGSNGAGAFWAAHNPVLQGCPHPFRKSALFQASHNLQDPLLKLLDI